MIWWNSSEKEHKHHARKGENIGVIRKVDRISQEHPLSGLNEIDGGEKS